MDHCEFGRRLGAAVADAAQPHSTPRLEHGTATLSRLDGNVEFGRRGAASCPSQLDDQLRPPRPAQPSRLRHCAVRVVCSSSRSLNAPRRPIDLLSPMQMQAKHRHALRRIHGPLPPRCLRLPPRGPPPRHLACRRRLRPTVHRNHSHAQSLATATASGGTVTAVALPTATSWRARTSPSLCNDRPPLRELRRRRVRGDRDEPAQRQRWQRTSRRSDDSPFVEASVCTRWHIGKCIG